MHTSYSREQLMSIKEQATIFQCACPAQVSLLLSEILSLYAYQEKCLNQTDTDELVHNAIKKATLETYPIIEKCLTDILTLEGWDMDTLTMPEALKKRILDSL